MKIIELIFILLNMALITFKSNADFRLSAFLAWTVALLYCIAQLIKQLKDGE